MRPTLPGIRLASVRARRSRNSIWALVLRSSPDAQCASAPWTAGSRRSSIFSRLPRAAGPPNGPVRPLVRRPAHWSRGTPPVRHWPSERLLTTGWASRSPARTTSRPVTMAGRRPAPLASRPSRFLLQPATTDISNRYHFSENAQVWRPRGGTGRRYRGEESACRGDREVPRSRPTRRGGYMPPAGTSGSRMDTAAWSRLG